MRLMMCYAESVVTLASWAIRASLALGQDIRALYHWYAPQSPSLRAFFSFLYLKIKNSKIYAGLGIFQKWGPVARWRGDRDLYVKKLIIYRDPRWGGGPVASPSGDRACRSPAGRQPLPTRCCCLWAKIILSQLSHQALFKRHDHWKVDARTSSHRSWNKWITIGNPETREKVLGRSRWSAFI